MSWSKKYKKSIDCSNPKGFSQKAHCDGRKARQRGEKTKSKSVNEMKLTRSQLKEIIREEIKNLNEEEYDIWRDYKAGTLTKQEYERAIADYRKQQQRLSRHPYSNYKDDLLVFGEMRIYFNIPFDKKDEFKKFYGARWDDKKKKWYLLLPKRKYSLQSFPFKDYYDKRETPTEFQKFIKI